MRLARCVAGSRRSQQLQSVGWQFGSATARCEAQPDLAPGAIAHKTLLMTMPEQFDPAHTSPRTLLCQARRPLTPLRPEKVALQPVLKLADRTSRCLEHCTQMIDQFEFSPAMLARRRWFLAQKQLAHPALHPQQPAPQPVTRAKTQLARYHLPACLHRLALAYSRDKQPQQIRTDCAATQRPRPQHRERLAAAASSSPITAPETPAPHHAPMLAVAVAKQ